MRRTSLLLVAALAALAAAVPATAATPTFKGTVGPGSTIAMAKKPSDRRKDRARRLRQVRLPQLPLRPARGEREDRRPGNRLEDVQGHAQEGHLPVRLRPARERDEGSFRVS